MDEMQNKYEEELKALQAKNALTLQELKIVHFVIGDNLYKKGSSTPFLRKKLNM